MHSCCQLFQKVINLVFESDAQKTFFSVEVATLDVEMLLLVRDSEACTH